MNDAGTHWSVGRILIFIACAVLLFCSFMVVVPHPHSRLESPQLVTAFLAQANENVASIRSREMNDQREMNAISFQLYFAAIEHPDLPEIWKTAASLINLQSNQKPNGTSTICGNSPETIRHDSASFKSESMTVINYRDCEILLDGSEWGSLDRSRSSAQDPQGVMLDLRNVRLNYQGGRFPQVSVITCMECTFDINLQTIPPPRGRSFIRGLLFADFSNFSIGIRDHDPPSFEERQRMTRQPQVARPQ